MAAYVFPGPRNRQEGRIICPGVMFRGREVTSIKKRDQEHRRQYRLTKAGSQIPRRKLDAKQVNEIRFGVETYATLAVRFGVSVNVIWLCAACHTYKDHPINPDRMAGRQSRKLTAAQVVEMRERAAKGEGVTKLARSFNCTTGTASCAINRRTYKWVK